MRFITRRAESPTSPTLFVESCCDKSPKCACNERTCRPPYISIHLLTKCVQYLIGYNYISCYRNEVICLPQRHWLRAVFSFAEMTWSQIQIPLAAKAVQVRVRDLRVQDKSYSRSGRDDWVHLPQIGVDQGELHDIQRSAHKEWAPGQN